MGLGNRPPGWIAELLAGRDRALAAPTAAPDGQKGDEGSEQEESSDGSGGNEHVPWSAWATEPRALHVLFNERLSRPWSPYELEGIAALFEHREADFKGR